MQSRIQPIYFVLLFFLASLHAGGQGASLHDLIRYNPWEQSANPAGIYYTPIDSLVEAGVGYNLTRPPLALSDQPSKEQNYGAGVYGYQRFNRLQLAGGISWKQDRREGHKWNMLVLRDHIVTAGDTIDEPQRLEQYCINGTAAYTFSSRLTAGLSGSYTATDNRNIAPESRYAGNAHDLTLSTGVIHEGEQLRSGVTLVYRHTSELISYPTDQNRLYTYPLGYYIPMAEISDDGNLLRSTSTANSSVLHSTGNNWKVALQAEWHPAGWNWFNELSAGYQHRRSNPNITDNRLGWMEQFGSLAYNSRLTRSRGRWTHLLSPQLSAQWGVSDRTLQYASEDDITSSLQTYATYRLAARQEIAAQLGYELARDYGTAGRPLAWQASFLWYRQQEYFYCHPFTHTQYTHQLRGEVAFVRDFTLRQASRLLLRPSLSMATGYGIEEEVSEEAASSSAVNNHKRSYSRVSQDYASRTATRLAFSLQAEYRRSISRTLTAGIRLQGGMEQVVEQESKAGGLLVASFFINL